MYQVYILKQSDGEYYTSSTSNLENRLKQHQNGQNFSTRHKKPVELVWSGSFETKKNGSGF
jgi:putative endonuclease